MVTWFGRSMIVAVAGRRIDTADAPIARFPLANRALVARRISAALQRLDATAVVASAACGADLLALDAAGRRGLRRRVILPYAEKWFLEDSVVDRPGRWAGAFRATCAAARAAGDLVLLGEARGRDDAFRAVNEVIAAEALRLAAGAAPADPAAALAALIVWEGSPRAPDDLTAHLRERMRLLGAHIVEVFTVRRLAPAESHA
jgi:hypothetical protein